MKIRKSIQIDQSLHDEIKELAWRDSRSVNKAICLLLQQAIKERNRKKNAKKVHIQDNSTN